MSEFLTLREAADFSGVKPESIQVRIAVGELKPRETTYLFSDADVVRPKTQFEAAVRKTF